MRTFSYTVLVILVAVLLIFGLCGNRSDRYQTTEGTVVLLSKILDERGNLIVIDTIKVWHFDSVAIQELHVIHKITDVHDITRFEYVNFGYRFFALREGRWFDLQNLSDTAKMTNSGSLPEKRFKDLGWVFYSKSAREIDGPPKLLGDTLIGSVNYKKFQFHLIGDKKTRTFRIGLLNCGIKDAMFSLEKSLTDSTGCAMTHLLTYLNGQATPIASFEVKYISDTIPTVVRNAIRIHVR